MALDANRKCKLVWPGKWEDAADLWGRATHQVASACCESQSHIFNELNYDK